MGVLFDVLIYRGVPGAQTLTDPGHIQRFDTSYGTGFKPYLFHGIANEGDEIGHVAGSTGYGNDKPLEWKGTPSQKAL